MPDILRVIDWEKPIETAKGIEARYIGKRLHAFYPYIVAVKITPNSERLFVCNSRGEGRVFSSDVAVKPYIQNAPTKIKVHLMTDIFGSVLVHTNARVISESENASCQAHAKGNPKTSRIVELEVEKIR